MSGDWDAKKAVGQTQDWSDPKKAIKKVYQANSARQAAERRGLNDPALFEQFARNVAEPKK